MLVVFHALEGYLKKIDTSKIVKTSSLNKGKLWDIGLLKVINLTTFVCKRWMLLR